MLIRRELRIFLLLTLLLLGAVACQAAATPEAAPPAPTATDAPTVAPTETAASTAPENSAQPTATPELADIFTIIARAEGLDTLATAAEQVGLADELRGADPLTVLLPTAAAFDDLPAAVRDNPEMMRTIVQEHLVAGAYHLTDMADPAVITTLNGDELALMVGETGGTIAGANVLAGDFEASNGIIHIIDTVILPPALEAEILALYEPIAGEVLEPMQGNNHINNGTVSPVAYRSTPPTSGPHYPNIAPWQVFTEPWRYEQLIHNLEDSGVVIYYQCADGCPDLVQQLRDLAQPYIDGGRHVLVAPNDPTWTLPNGDHPHQDMGAPLAVAAWRRLLKLNTFDADQINAFIDAFEGIDHHVK